MEKDDLSRDSAGEISVNPKIQSLELKKEHSPKKDEIDLDSSKINVTETIGGSSTRKYLNQFVTPTLLKGMRIIAKDKPENPLKTLGEYLIRESEDNH